MMAKSASRSDAPVVADQTNHIKLAIADALDRSLDSWVLIQAGSLQAVEVCDNGIDDDEDGLTDLDDPDCFVCGDGTQSAGEECDDGNTTSGDGCSALCRLEICGNDVLDPNEECDDGGTLPGDGCSATCRVEVCGNSFLDPGEECDDGNLAAGDGCSATCTTEPLCQGGVAIDKPKIVLAKLAGTPDDEGLVFSGKMLFGSGQPAGFDPLDMTNRGAQLLIEDLGNGASAIFELSHRTYPVPAGQSTAVCDARKQDGWKSNRPESSYVYTNRTDALPAAACAPGSASGLTSLKLVDKRDARNPAISFVARAKGLGLPTPVGPLRGTIVLGSAPSAGLSGACATHEFEVGDCALAPSGRKMTCR